MIRFKTKLAGIIVFSLLQFQSFSQDIIFQQRINAASLQPQERVSEALLQNYSITQYSKETSFYPGDEFRLLLPDETVIVVEQKSWQYHSAGSFSFVGEIAGQPNSSVVLSKFGNRWHGMVTTESLKKFIIHQTADQVFALSEVNELSFEQQDITEDYEMLPGAVAANYNVCDAANPCTANPVTISLMVVYTPGATAAWGGSAQAVSAITTAVTNMNVANSNSGVNSSIQFNLVHSEEVAYTESGSTNTDLSRLANGSDTYMDIVQTLRITHQADLVSLVVGSPTTTCGLGYVNTNPTNYTANAGYNVVVYNCVVSNYSMAHEFGHNMGLRHDRHVDASSTPCAHHHGYVNQAAFVVGAPTTKRWRTVLAYNDQCAASGFNCSRVNYWANPSILRTSDPMGIAVGQPNSADEVYGINRFACVVASFQGLSVVPLRFIDLKGKISGKTVSVNWQTSNELNVDKFEVEVAYGLPQHFSGIGTVDAKNMQTNFYRYEWQTGSTATIFIRIKGIDISGAVKYSSVINLKTAQENFAFNITNPVQDLLRVEIFSPANAPGFFQLISPEGKVLHSHQQAFSKGNSIHSINTADLSQGLYILRIQYGGKKHSTRFIRY